MVLFYYVQLCHESIDFLTSSLPLFLLLGLTPFQRPLVAGFSRCVGCHDVHAMSRVAQAPWPDS